jgi:hypothetical protein
MNWSGFKVLTVIYPLNGRKCESLNEGTLAFMHRLKNGRRSKGLDLIEILIFYNLCFAPYHGYELTSKPRILGASRLRRDRDRRS